MSGKGLHSGERGPVGRRRPDLESVTTINPDGSHHVLYPADVRGRFTRARRVVAVLLILVYVSLPWIPVNGAPAVFLDIAHRRFHFLGLAMSAQDLWVLFFAISGLGFLLFVVTAVLGRIWCGWACPYTVFLEHVYRRIERWVDGDAVARRRLAAAPMDAGKLVRRMGKHGLFFLVSLLIAHVFLSYFVSLPGLYSLVREGPAAHAAVFAGVMALTGVLWFCFSSFREQFCILMCPYGRLQSALTDEDTMIIGYDARRGEPRGGGKSGAVGDCIDCNRCVAVCPTGIDIRDGLQLECIGCAACIDACHEVMARLGRPAGLTRYDSARGLAGQRRRVLRPRLLAYGLLAGAGLVALGVTAAYRGKPMAANLSRMRGQPFYADANAVRNHFQLRLINKRNQPMRIRVGFQEAPQGYRISGADKEIVLGPHEDAARSLVVLAAVDSYGGPGEIVLRFEGDPGGAVITRKVDFLGPHPDHYRTMQNQPPSTTP